MGVQHVRKECNMQYEDLTQMAIPLDPEVDIWVEHPYQPEPYRLGLRTPNADAVMTYNNVGPALCWVDETRRKWVIYVTKDRIACLKEAGYILDVGMPVVFTGAEPVWPQEVAEKWEASKPRF